MASATPDFSISLVTGILPYCISKNKKEEQDKARRAHRRTYVPKSSRPHLLWSTSYSAKNSSSYPFSSVGKLLNAQTGSKGASTSQIQYGIQQLLTVDAETGLRLQQYGSVPREKARYPSPVSAPIPSAQPIAALCLGPNKGTQHVSDVVYVSDVVGNIYTATAKVVSSSSELAVSPLTVRRRLENSSTDSHEALFSTDSSFLSSEWEWSLLTPSHAIHTSMLEKKETGSGKARLKGLPGWAGLSTLHYPGEQYLLSLREFYQDARVVDCERDGVVVHTYGLTHAPTGLHTPFGLPYCFVAAEGAQCTVFDTRCPGVAMTWKESSRLNAVKEEVSDGIAKSDARAEDSPRNANKGKISFPSLIQQQFTSVSGLVRDICGTPKPLEIAACIDRALCVFDLRRFNRLFTSSNVLKYNISSITPVGGGKGIVCTGIDSEVCVIPLPTDLRFADDQKKSLAAHKISEDGLGNSKKGGEGEDTSKASGAVGLSAASEELAGTFRARLNRSVRCEEAWQGGWVASSRDDDGGSGRSNDNRGGACAVGVSITGELFLAQ